MVFATPNFFLATVLPHNIGLPNNTADKLLFNNANHAQCKIRRQEIQPPTPWQGDSIHLAHRPRAYCFARAAAIGIRRCLAASDRITSPHSL